MTDDRLTGYATENVVPLTVEERLHLLDLINVVQDDTVLAVFGLDDECE